MCHVQSIVLSIINFFFVIELVFYAKDFKNHTFLHV